MLCSPMLIDKLLTSYRSARSEVLWSAMRISLKAFRQGQNAVVSHGHHRAPEDDEADGFVGERKRNCEQGSFDVSATSTNPHLQRDDRR